MMRKPLIIFFELGLCAGLLAFISLTAMRSFQPTSATAAMAVARHFAPPTMKDVEVGLYRIGITPETLTASGGSTGDVNTIIDRMLDALTNEPGLLILADEELAQAQREADRLTRLVRSGQATQQQRTECQQAVQTLAQVKAAQQEMLDALFNEVVQPLDAAIKSALQTFRTNERWRMPTEFRIVERAAADWVRLRAALANERISATLDEDPDQDDQTFLTSERAKADIALAAARLDAGLNTINNQWNSRINQQ